MRKQWTFGVIWFAVLGWQLQSPWVCTAFANHKICGGNADKGGCLCVSKDGSIVFGTEDVGPSYWQLSTQNGGGTIAHFIEGKWKYLTIDEKGEKLCFSDKIKPGSMWKYAAIGHIRGGMSRGKQTKISTAEVLNGGPFYLAIDVENPLEMESPYRMNKDRRYTVYPVKITTNKNLAGTELGTLWLAP